MQLAESDCTLRVTSTHLCATVSRNFTTHTDNQTSILLKLFEGEHEKTKYCQPVLELEFGGISPAKKSVPAIEFEFTVDEKQRVSVTASDRTRGDTSLQVISANYVLAGGRGGVAAGYIGMCSDWIKGLLEEKKPAGMEVYVHKLETSFGLRVKSSAGILAKLDEGTVLPATTSKTGAKAQQDNQNWARIPQLQLCEGKSVTNKCRNFGPYEHRIEINGGARIKKGDPLIKLTLEVDTERKVKVTAQNLATGLNQLIANTTLSRLQLNQPL
jgi:molecular chaperone DnaK (HSP70)